MNNFSSRDKQEGKTKTENRVVPLRCFVYTSCPTAIFNYGQHRKISTSR